MDILINYLAVIIFLPLSINCQEALEKIYIKDLRVDTIATTSNFLQLKIQWTGSDNLKDAKYDVYVTPEKDEYCSEDSCTRLDYKLNEILLPDPNKHNECSINPSCVYDVAIKTHIDKGYGINATYRVPECMGKYCSCRHSSSIPNITLSTETFSTEIRITWSLHNSTVLPVHPLEKVIISVVEVKDDIYLRAEDKYSELLYTNKRNSTKTRGVVDYKLKNFIQHDSFQEIIAVVQDSRGCFGEKTFEKVFLPVDTGTNKWPFIAIIALVILIVLVFVGKILTKKFLIFPITPQRIPQALTTVYYPIDTRNNLKCTNMFENELYINKDIMEARKQCGFDCPDLEIPYTRLTIGKEIGKGAFGRVYIGTISSNDGPKVVAVKQLKKQPTQEELEEFLSEIATMKRVGSHPNIVTIYGCCTKRLPLTMIMEYVGCGDLQNYLRRVRDKLEIKFRHSRQSTGTDNVTQISRSTSTNSNNTVFSGKYLEIMRSSGSSSDASYITQPDTFRPSVTETQCTSLPYDTKSIEYVLDHNELHNFAIQIARGMNHLENKMITHRDLAARNILISEQKVLKISDFGLSRTGIYVNTKNKRVPLRWLSIEAIRDNLYSSKSDVWAFGIVLWEIGTLGAHPYCTLDNNELLTFLINGGRLERPENCSKKLYALMLDCWQHKPQDRPSFEDIVNLLEPQKQTIYIDFNEMSPTYVLPPITQQTNVAMLQNS